MLVIDARCTTGDDDDDELLVVNTFDPVDFNMNWKPAAYCQTRLMKIEFKQIIETAKKKILKRETCCRRIDHRW